MGFALGDGSLIFTKKTHTVSFFGKAENLEEIRNDVMKLGFTPSRIYSRIRKGNIKTKYGLKSFTTVEHSFKVASRSFATLLKAMGVPSGIKAQQNFVLPKWVFKLPLWQKRLLLASFFGAELSSPLTMTWRNRTFYAPTLSQSKKAAYVNSGLAFMLQIKKLLQELGVSVNAITLEPKVNYGGGGAPSTRIRLQIKSTPENLIKLWSTIGFEYNYEKSFLANVAVAYLKLKEKIIRERSMTAKVVIAMRERGVKVQQIYQSLENNGVNHSFTERSLYGGRKTSPRIPLDFPSFKEYLEEATKGLGRSGAVWDRIVTKEEVQFSDFVYDFTVGDSNHNFIANGFVVSNCGVRLLRTNLDEKDVRPALLKLLDTLFDYIPSGLGSRGRIHVTPIELDKVVSDGVEWAVDKGYGWAEDIKRCEENGCMEAADPAKVSSTAKSRGCPQLGSLGSGNHFLEIEKVDRIFDQKVAESLGIKRLGQVLVLIHTGSRGFGHQVCSDYLRVMERAIHKYNIQLPDRELACAPAKSSEAEDYFAAMSAACNYAWANRQMITHWTREAFEKVFGKPADSLDMHLIYDVAHNIAKIEEHKVDGKRLKVFVHRKGATRAFPPGHGDVPAEYRELGQPVLIPGSMGTSSWILVGTPKAMEISFGSTAHGAGRYLSRASAKKRFWGSDVKKALEEKGILIKAASMAVVSEEAPGAYKDVDRVAEVSHELGIAKKVCRLVPMGVTKG
jgi:tRNA-splicing ligase RtcB